jgi:hypothetical protein
VTCGAGLQAEWSGKDATVSLKGINVNPQAGSGITYVIVCMCVHVCLSCTACKADSGLVQRF